MYRFEINKLSVALNPPDELIIVTTPNGEYFHLSFLEAENLTDMLKALMECYEKQLWDDPQMLLPPKPDDDQSDMGSQ